jgi:hypothetical protein
MVPGVTLRELVDDYFPLKGPDLICIDAEGSDLEVLKSLDLSTLEEERKPFALLVETLWPVDKVLDSDIVKYAIRFGYRVGLILPMSTILVRAESISDLSG